MPYKISTYPLSAILFIKFSGHITVEEATAANSEEIHVLDQMTETAFFVADLSQIESVDGSLNQLRDTFVVLRHPNLRHVVVIGSPNRLVEFLSSAALQLFKVKFQRCSTLTQAAEFIQEELEQTETFCHELEDWLNAEAQLS